MRRPLQRQDLVDFLQKLIFAKKRGISGQITLNFGADGESLLMETAFKRGQLTACSGHYAVVLASLEAAGIPEAIEDAACGNG